MLSHSSCAKKKRAESTASNIKKKKRERAGEQRRKEGKEVQREHFTQSRQLTALTQEVTIKKKKEELDALLSLLFSLRERLRTETQNAIFFCLIPL